MRAVLILWIVHFVIVLLLLRGALMAKAKSEHDVIDDYAARLPLRWADANMFPAVPHSDVDPRYGVVPRVSMLEMTRDPLGSIACAYMMYEGRVPRAKVEVTDDQRRYYWDQAMATNLKAPFEFIDMHFLLDGVDRAFTAQLERQRTAVYAEQSLRFAVIEDLKAGGTSLPVTLIGTRPLVELWDDDAAGIDPYAGLTPEQRRLQEMRAIWDSCIEEISSAYMALVNSGMPSEEARGLLPLSVATRVEYKTNLRNLAEHAGNRLCTQAQFPWKVVFNGIVQAIRNFGSDLDAHNSGDADFGTGWQYHLIADSMLFRPVCYSLGSCPWNAELDRRCIIRSRVDQFVEIGVKSGDWHLDHFNNDGDVVITGIDNAEWLFNPRSAGRPPS